MGNKHAGGHKYGQVGQPIYGNGARHRWMDKLLPSGAEHRLRHCEGQAHHDDGLQRRAGGPQNLPRARRVYARPTRHSVWHARRTLLRHPRGAERHYSGGETWRFHRRRDALLHAPAVQRVRKDDYQCRHPPCRVSGGLPGLLLAGYFEEAKVQLERFDPENAPEINP